MNIMEKRNTDLIKEFNRYIRDHPKFADIAQCKSTATKHQKKIPLNFFGLLAISRNFLSANAFISSFVLA